MGLDDKVQNTGKDGKGKAKEATGAATGNDKLKSKVKDEQGQATSKEAGKNVKDALKPQS